MAKFSRGGVLKTAGLPASVKTAIRLVNASGIPILVWTPSGAVTQPRRPYRFETGMLLPRLGKIHDDSSYRQRQQLPTAPPRRRQTSAWKLAAAGPRSGQALRPARLGASASGSCRCDGAHVPRGNCAWLESFGVAHVGQEGGVCKVLLA